MKTKTVYVYHWPKEGNVPETWLGYTTYQGSGGDGRLSTHTVEAETRGKAITKAIQEAKYGRSCSTCQSWTPKPDFKTGVCFSDNTMRHDPEEPRPLKNAGDKCPDWQKKEEKK